MAAIAYIQPNELACQAVFTTAVLKPGEVTVIKNGREKKKSRQRIINTDGTVIGIITAEGIINPLERSEGLIDGSQPDFDGLPNVVQEDIVDYLYFLPKREDEDEGTIRDGDGVEVGRWQISSGAEVFTEWYGCRPINQVETLLQRIRQMEEEFLKLEEMRDVQKVTEKVQEYNAAMRGYHHMTAKEEIAKLKAELEVDKDLRANIQEFLNTRDYNAIYDFLQDDLGFTIRSLPIEEYDFLTDSDDSDVPTAEGTDNYIQSWIDYDA